MKCAWVNDGLLGGSREWTVRPHSTERLDAKHDDGNEAADTGAAHVRLSLRMVAIAPWASRAAIETHIAIDDIFDAITLSVDLRLVACTVRRLGLAEAYPTP